MVIHCNNNGTMTSNEVAITKVAMYKINLAQPIITLVIKLQLLTSYKDDHILGKLITFKVRKLANYWLLSV